MISRIRIPSKWRDRLSFGRSRAFDNEGLAEFVLGVGPCGKTVETLEIDYLAAGVLITQHCTCKERKEFLYPYHTITGRVEVTHG